MKALKFLVRQPSFPFIVVCAVMAGLLFGFVITHQRERRYLHSSMTKMVHVCKEIRGKVISVSSLKNHDKLTAQELSQIVNEIDSPLNSDDILKISRLFRMSISDLTCGDFSVRKREIALQQLIPVILMYRVHLDDEDVSFAHEELTSSNRIISNHKQERANHRSVQKILDREQFNNNVILDLLDHRESPKALRQLATVMHRGFAK